MTLPMSSPFVSGAVVTKAELDQLVTVLNELPRGFIGDASDASGTKTFGATLTDMAGTSASAVTFTLTDQRRVEITVQARFVPLNAVVGRYSIQAGYNTGTTINVGSVTKVGLPISVYNAPASTGDSGSTSQIAFGSPLLAPGTYTAYAVMQRVNGGSSGDTATSFRTVLEDIGAT